MIQSMVRRPICLVIMASFLHPDSPAFALGLEGRQAPIGAGPTSSTWPGMPPPSGCLPSPLKGHFRGSPQLWAEGIVLECACPQSLSSSVLLLALVSTVDSHTHRSPGEWWRASLFAGQLTPPWELAFGFPGLPPPISAADVLKFSLLLGQYTPIASEEDLPFGRWLLMNGVTDPREWYCMMWLYWHHVRRGHWI